LIEGEIADEQGRHKPSVEIVRHAVLPKNIHALIEDACK